MDAKLTAGPWVVGVLDPDRQIDGTMLFCVSLGGMDGNGGCRPNDDDKRGEYLRVSGYCRPADAAAMGAAGEMLAALRELLAVTPAKAPAADVLVGIEDRHRAAINAARAAITKATTLPKIPTLPAGEADA